MTQTLLIELRTEELPPKALNLLGNSLAASVASAGKRAIDRRRGRFQRLCLAAPLGRAGENVKAVQADRRVVKKGLAVAAGMKDGTPTKALEGFARSCGAEITALSVVNDGKQDVYAYEYTQQGQPLSALISEILAQAVKKLPIPKVMRWGSSTHTFVRPVHGLVVMHGADTVAAEVLGLSSQNATLGHRFLSDGQIVFADADAYAEQMRAQGKVIASFAERKAAIQAALNEQAGCLNATVAADEALLDEVTALVEWLRCLKRALRRTFCKCRKNA